MCNEVQEIWACSSEPTTKPALVTSQATGYPAGTALSTAAPELNCSSTAAWKVVLHVRSMGFASKLPFSMQLPRP